MANVIQPLLDGCAGLRCCVIRTYVCTQRERYYNDMWYTIRYHLQRDNTRNIAVVHIIRTPEKGLKMTTWYYTK